ncbi:MAG: glycosyltransferase [Rhodocyclaceae bacterium]|nr:glycosyltransferase [Rhodocyclaceae bacterium]
MKILHLSFSDGPGGAGRAAYRLHKALGAVGVDSRMRVRLKTRDDDTVSGPAGGWERLSSWLRPQAGHALRRASSLPANPWRSYNLLPSGWLNAINRSDADVVHLHWVGDECLSIEDLGRIEKPLVWTFHDMWPFCGAEHVADPGPAAPWRSGYATGPRLDAWTWRRKRRAWSRPLHIVTPSRWLGDCAAASPLFQGRRISVVPNPLPTLEFAPIDRKAARHALGLAEDTQVLLFAAHGVGVDPNKGWGLLVEALRQLAGRKDLVLAVAGEEAPPPGIDVGVALHWLGRLADEAAMARAYSAADVTVVASRLENFPQAATEALACGCPVAGFATTGVAETVGDARWLAAPFDAEDLGRVIGDLLNAPDAEMRRRAARERATALWSPEAVLPRFVEVYEQALNGQKGAR